MTPLAIKIMLHYYSSGARYDGVEFGSPAWDDTTAQLQSSSLLIRYHGNDELQITDRGKAYVEALCRVPLPVQKWVMPEE